MARSLLNGNRVKAVVRLTTLFLPGRVPRQVVESQWNKSRLSRFATLLTDSPFRLSPPAVPAVAVLAKPAPPPFPYHKWSLTGLIESPLTEAHIRNAASGKSHVLRIGDRFHEMELVDVRGFVAEFILDGKVCLVELGSTMVDRRELSDAERIGSAQ